MDAGAAADDLYKRLRAVGERTETGRSVTISLILDGENAWEYYHRNGRAFLREFYRRIEADPDIRALTVSEALRAAGEVATVQRIAPGSWINANFDIWIGDAEDVAGWNLLRAARDFYTSAVEKRARTEKGSPTEAQLAAALEALLTAEGSDWFWWFGPENSSADDAEFDAFFRKLLSEVYRSLGAAAPDTLAGPIKRQADHAEILPPSSLLDVRVDGRDTNYFEWLGAGLYSPDQRDSAMHGRVRLLRQIHYGFSASHFFVRADVFEGVLNELADGEFRLTLRGDQELRVVIHLAAGKVKGYLVEAKEFCLMEPSDMVSVACDRFLEVSIARTLLRPGRRGSFSMVVALWEGGLPVDVLPVEGALDVRLGEEHFAWPVE